MSRKQREENKRRDREKMKRMSTATRGFQPGAELNVLRENLHEKSSEDIRLEKFTKHTNPEKEKEVLEVLKGRKVMDIYEESPNGHVITRKAPKGENDAIKYYSERLKDFSLELAPEEYGLVHYKLAQIFIMQYRWVGMHKMSLKADVENRQKSMENAFFHLSKAQRVFRYDSHPIMFAIICTMQGQLFREKSIMLANRYSSTKRAAMPECLRGGLDALEEAISVFFQSKLHVVEHAVCALEAGWLYIIKAEDQAHQHDPLINEQAVSYLDKAIAFAQSTADPFRYVEKSTSTLVLCPTCQYQSCRTKISKLNINLETLGLYSRNHFLEMTSLGYGTLKTLHLIRLISALYWTSGRYHTWRARPLSSRVESTRTGASLCESMK